MDFIINRFLMKWFSRKHCCLERLKAKQERLNIIKRIPNDSRFKSFVNTSKYFMSNVGNSTLKSTPRRFISKKKYTQRSPIITSHIKWPTRVVVYTYTMVSNSISRKTSKFVNVFLPLKKKNLSVFLNRVSIHIEYLIKTTPLYKKNFFRVVGDPILRFENAVVRTEVSLMVKNPLLGDFFVFQHINDKPESKFKMELYSYFYIDLLNIGEEGSFPKIQVLIDSILLEVIGKNVCQFGLTQDEQRIGRFIPVVAVYCPAKTEKEYLTLDNFFKRLVHKYANRGFTASLNYRYRMTDGHSWVVFIPEEFVPGSNPFTKFVSMEYYNKWNQILLFDYNFYFAQNRGNTRDSLSKLVFEKSNYIRPPQRAMNVVISDYLHDKGLVNNTMFNTQYKNGVNNLETLGPARKKEDPKALSGDTEIEYKVLDWGDKENKSKASEYSDKRNKSKAEERANWKVESENKKYDINKNRQRSGEASKWENTEGAFGNDKVFKSEGVELSLFERGAADKLNKVFSTKKTNSVSWLDSVSELAEDKLLGQKDQETVHLAKEFDSGKKKRDAEISPIVKETPNNSGQDAGTKIEQRVQALFDALIYGSSLEKALEETSNESTQVKELLHKKLQQNIKEWSAKRRSSPRPFSPLRSLVTDEVTKLKAFEHNEPIFNVYVNDSGETIPMKIGKDGSLVPVKEKDKEFSTTLKLSELNDLNKRK